MNKVSTFANAHPLSALMECEPVVLDAHLIERSWAYYLAPRDIGTPTCESLTSYYLRLSYAHHVSPGQMFDRGLKPRTREFRNPTIGRGLVTASSISGTWQINGNGMVAEKWVAALQDATLRKDLQFLTFLPYREALSKRNALRTQRAWCAACFGDEHPDRDVHEQLLWMCELVLICPIHKIRLRTICPQCNRSSYPLKSRMLPGRCPYCTGWLGCSSIDCARADAKPSEYDLFVANEVGSLIASGPSVQEIFTREGARKSILNFIDKSFDGNVRAFTRHFGFTRGHDSELVDSRKNSFVRLDIYLKLAFLSGITVLDLLTKENALSEFSKTLPANSGRSRRSAARRNEQVRAALEAAGHEIPPPSISEVALRLGYKSSGALRRYSGAACDLIDRNYRASERWKKAHCWRRTRLRSTSDLEAALKQALRQNPVPSVKELTKSLGYKSSASLYKSLPELTRRLAGNPPRRSSQEIIDILTRALETDPPEDLSAVAKSLKYSATTLPRIYPELCRQIRSRYHAHKQNLLLAEIRLKLDAMLSETPPPTLRTVLRRLGFSPGWLTKYFLEERRAIVKRYLDFRKQQTMLNRKEERNQIRATVHDLHSQGTFPSMAAVERVIRPNYLKFPDFWETTKRAREELSSATDCTLPLVL